MLPADRDVGIPDADARPVRPLRVLAHGHVGGCVGGGRLDVYRHAVVVGDPPLVAVPLEAAEVLVDDLADAQPVVADRRDHDLLGVEALRVQRLAEPAAPRQQRPGDDDDGHEGMTPPERA